MKALSSMNFNDESASEVKYNFVMDLSQTVVVVDLIHSLQNFRCGTANNRLKNGALDFHKIE